MNLQQQQAWSRATEGHNVLLLGQSGTGKSFVVKRIYESLSEKGLTVARTGTTGISALQIEGITIHSWSGFGDGRNSRQELHQKIQDDEFYESYKKNILTTDCLVIDEISMMSSKMFEDVEYVCRNIRDPDKYFGGIQVIGVGDFFQLPPVPDHNIGDPGEFPFKSPFFNSVFPHTIILTDVVRQNEPDFIRAIHETSLGTCETDTLQLLNRLSRPLPPGKSPVRLCAKKFECEVYNATQLMDMEGDVFTYKAVSEGKQSELNKMVVPEVLHLKVGCSVLLVKNLSKSLVNGMRGIVKECKSDSVVVEFSGTGVNGTKTATIKRETFSVYNMEEGKVIASRFQLPLTLGYSMPIHKAQGLTLDRVVVDATNIFSPGQLGVAIGRATCKKGLRLIGFRQSELLPASPDVTKFYKRFSTDFSDSFECCKYSVSVIDNLLTDYEDNYVSSDEESEFSDTEIYDLDGMFPDIFPGNQGTEPERPSCSVGENSSNVNEQIDELPFTFSKLESLFSETVSTQKQAAIRAHLNEIKNNESFKSCLNKIYCDISKILVENCGDSTKKTEPKHWTAFYSGMYKYTISDQYLDLLRAFYGNGPSDLACDAFGKVVDKLIEIILEERTAPILESTPPTPIPVAITGAGLGNIRYIGGRCIAKAKYHLMKSVKANLYKPKRKHDVNESFTKVRMLDYLTTRSSETKHKESLNETERRQNLGRGLTSITDDCFAFFLSLNKINMQHQTDQNLQIYGPEVFSKTKESALNNKGLRQSWDSMFENYKVPDAAAAVAKEIRNSLLHDIISRFLRIGNNQFRKDSIRKMGKKKTESLRKKVVVEKSQTDKLHRVRDGLDGEAKSGKKRQVRTEINESVAGPSEDSREKGKKRKKTGGRKGKCKQSKEEEVTYCGLCQMVYEDGEPWIQCDSCNEWFDCDCQNVSRSEFERLTNEAEEIPWMCIECKGK